MPTKPREPMKPEEIVNEMIDNLRRNVAADKKRRAAQHEAPQQFVSKPVTKWALRFDGSHDSAQRVISWMNAENPKFDPNDSGTWTVSGYYGTLTIRTLEGDMEAVAGDWIIKGLKGEFYPCKPDIFAQSYKPLSTSSQTPPTPIMPMDAVDVSSKWPKAAQTPPSETAREWYARYLGLNPNCAAMESPGSKRDTDLLESFEVALRSSGMSHPHHIFCNYQHGPIGASGCICVVTYKKHLQELEALEKASSGMGTPPYKREPTCGHKSSDGFVCCRLLKHPDHHADNDGNHWLTSGMAKEPTK